MTRKECLDTAADAVLRDRSKTHGTPEDNFATIAAFWNIYLLAIGYHPIRRPLNSTDNAAMMILMKVARIASNPNAPDHWADSAGYAACGCEIATEVATAKVNPLDCISPQGNRSGQTQLQGETVKDIAAST